MQEDRSSLMDFGGGVEEEQKQGSNPQNTATNQTDSNPRVVFQASQLAPIIDRMGRMLIDFAPHLNTIVKQHHTTLRD